MKKRDKLPRRLAHRTAIVNGKIEALKKRMGLLVAHQRRLQSEATLVQGPALKAEDLDYLDDAQMRAIIERMLRAAGLIDE